MSNNKLIFHIDVNSAFLSWEACKQLKINPDAVDIREIPAVIGGDESRRHGIVLAKSVPAKRYGINTAEPLASARKKCPNLLVIPPDFSQYANCSNAFISYLNEVAPVVEQYSIDEAFCDMTGTTTLYGDPIIFAHKMKNEIYNRYGFTVNIGISTNKLLAKMASDFQKPDKVHTLFPDEIPNKMWPLPVNELFLVGKSTAAKLHALGFHTIGDIARCDKSLLVNLFKKQGETIWNYANGIDNEHMTRSSTTKSYGNSITLSHDVTDESSAKMVLLSLCETVGARIRADRAYIGSVSVTITDTDFNNHSKQCTLTQSTNITEDIYMTALKLFDELWNHTPIRLLGVSTAHTSDTNTAQVSLFSNPQNEKLAKLNSAVDKIREKYGEDSIKRARFIGSDYTHMTGGLNKEKRQ